jgi:peptidylprolyl isomerase
MLLTLLCSFCLFAAEPNTKALSEALGHWIGKNLHELPLDVDALAKGLQDEAAGKESPMDEAECLREMGALEESQRVEQARVLRAQAEKILQDNLQNPAIHTLADGQVQYEVLKEGTGEPVASYNSPIVRFAGQSEELLSLDSAVLGLKMAIEGMKEGEVRKIFIHPDLGAGDALSTIELELIRADASGSDAEQESLSEIAPLR